MTIEIFQLVILLVIISIPFKFIFFKKTPTESTPPASKTKDSQRTKKSERLLESFEPHQRTIEEVQKQSSSENSVCVPADSGASKQMIIHFEVQENQRSLNNEQDQTEKQMRQIKLIKEQPYIKNEEVQELSFSHNQAEQILKESIIKQSQPPSQIKQQISFALPRKCTIESQQDSQPSLINSQAKAHDFNTQHNPRTVESIQIKNSISECGDQSYIDQLHSNVIRIDKRSKHLKILKEHYKSIIQNLKQKLEQACIRHNESFSEIDLDQTITFSQEQSSYLDENDRGQLEVRAEEVANLKNQLQLHQDAITSIIEEDNRLKDQLKSLEKQNKELKTALISSQIQQAGQEGKIQLDSSVLRSCSVKESMNGQQNEDVYRSEIKQKEGVQSRILQLYTSQVIGTKPFKSSLTNSLIFPKQSTISIMSLVEGVMNIGMLGECRFLNEISKKFTMGQIKKFTKQRISSAELLFSYQEQNDENQAMAFKMFEHSQNVLFLIKMTDKNIAIFTQSILRSDNQDLQTDNRILLLDLSRRKSFIHEGICSYEESHIILGDEGEGFSVCPPFLLKRGSWCQKLGLQKENMISISIFQIVLQVQE